MNKINLYVKLIMLFVYLHPEKDAGNMKILFNQKFLLHNADSEAEGSYRLSMFKKCADSDVNGESYIELVHPKDYIEQIRNQCLNSEKIAEINLTPDSWEAAKTAVGLAVRASENGDFAAIRPPGHHAGRASSMGFCLFNNIAIAAQKLAEEGKKVFIFDFDAHHGNGTQEIFYQEDRVMYCSIHQMFSFPHTGLPHETGFGKGKGFTANLPLSIACDDEQFLKAVDKAIEIGHNFEPDVVAISAGFDGYYKDRMMNMDISLKAYYECGFRLGKAFSNVFAVLEGGYHEDIFQCVRDFVEGINVGSRPIRDRFNHEMSIG
ncbi:MAG: histone deacetylase [Bacteroidales bacterium]|nr:histone deacetylase [Bacteroidales bacterium]